jgi:hypothetical protein
MTNLTETQADVIKSFAIFYLLLLANYIGSSLFTCLQINTIKTHKSIQLFSAFLLFFFSVTLISNTGNLEFTPPIEKLVHSFIYFIGFLIVMRLDMRISALVLLFIFIIYFIELNKDFYLDLGSKITNPHDKTIYNDNKYWITLNNPYKIRLFKVKQSDFKFINTIEKIIYYVIVILLVMGFIAYGGEIHDTLSKSNKLTWRNIILDTNICKLQDKKSFWHYFYIGLGIKI